MQETMMRCINFDEQPKTVLVLRFCEQPQFLRLKSLMPLPLRRM